MTTVDIDRSERGRREFAEVMTFDPPDDSSPSMTHGLIEFVFGEVAGFKYPISAADQHVAGQKIHRAALIFRLWEETDHGVACIERLDFSGLAADEDRRAMPGVDVMQSVAARVH